MDFAWLLAFISAAAGAYFGAYLKTKGENLATHEDIDWLKEKVAAVTETTKKIETEISDAAWNRQKRWELKREALFEVAKSLNEIDEALPGLSGAITAEIDGRADREVVDEKREALLKAAKTFQKSNGVVAVTCDRETYIALLKFKVRAVQIAIELPTNPNTYDDSIEELAWLFRAARAAIRKELGIPEIDA